MTWYGMKSMVWTALWYGNTLWYGMVWCGPCGVVWWCGVQWCGVVQGGVAWCGVDPVPVVTSDCACSYRLSYINGS